KRQLTGFAVAWMAWWVPLAAVALPVYVDRLPNRSLPLVPTPGRPVWRVESAAELGVVAVLGLLFLWVLTPLLVRGAAHLQAALASALLGPTAGSLVAHARAARDHGVQAEAADRRRIERDLHDGAQARLVTLAMSLGRARQRFDSDPAGARALVDAAHEHAKQALVELRDLARGIHPAILADRGLNAALSALAARSPVPVVVTCPDGRFPDAVESAAYFVVAEALANVAKHARATSAAICVSRQDGRLVVDVTDDGRGGADAGGAGLKGLADRVAALDGTLALSSPAGGPTIVRVELPCES
ncbi:MAG: sensor histidine kinase, partial [Egibacteraceae bacterium]